MSSAKNTIQKILTTADVKTNGGRPWDIMVHNEKFYKRALSGGSLAFGESYVDGWWDVKALDECAARIAGADLQRAVKLTPQIVSGYLQSSFFNMQSRARARRNVATIYNLSPKLYESFLDPYKQYTCGYFKGTDDLNKAQELKLDLICRKLQLKTSDEVLDIGCGWGGFAKFASERYGCHVTGITLSDEQIEYARRYTKGLPVTILKKDYRDMRGTFDKILVCGMIEHVGHKNYRAFMKVVNRCLTADGLFLLHTIGRNVSGALDPWIKTYIFPIGMLPSAKQLAKASEKLFVMEDWHNFGAYYDKTLMAWFHNFDKNWGTIKAGFDDRFYRMWKYYLLSCAGFFRARDIQLWQIVFSKRGVPGGYQSIR